MEKGFVQGYGTAVDILTMLGMGNPILLLICVLGVAIVLLLVRSHFNAEARDRRRRDNSHRPVISRRQGPTVRLAVDVDKPRRGRKR
jgi:hypothetical protein